ncbi:unnamed protein product [Amaranthus hypochondriacus]
MEEHQRDSQNESKKNSILIEIPSYQQVLESQQKSTPPSFFTPSPTFSQAFASIKKSEFYIPPPPPPPTSTTDSQSFASNSATNASSFSSAVPSSSGFGNLIKDYPFFLCLYKYFELGLTGCCLIF